MPYNSSTSAYERRAATVIDATPDGDTVAVAIDVKLDQGIDDYVTDLNHHNANGNHYPVTAVADDSRYLDQSPAGVVSWKVGVPAANAALKDMSNVADGAITSAKLASVAPAKVTQDASNRFVTDTEKSTWNGALYDKDDVEAVLTGTITSHTHTAASEGSAGMVELATTAEAAAGADTSRAVTAAGVDAYHKAKNINLGASVAASGTAVDFVGIPEGVKRVTVMFDGVSTNGSSNYLTQLGGAGGIENTGYLGTGFGVAGTSVGVSPFVTNGFSFPVTNAGSNVSGSATVNTLGENTWAFNGAIASSTDARAWAGAGSKALSGPLDRIRITTANGTDTFDAGTINISWEF